MESPRTTEEIAHYAGKSKRSAERMLKTLRDTGFDVKIYTPKGGRGPRLYEVTLPGKLLENKKRIKTQIANDGRLELRDILNQPFLRKSFFIQKLPSLSGFPPMTQGIRFNAKLMNRSREIFSEQEENILKTSLLEVYRLIQTGNLIDLFDRDILVQSFFAKKLTTPTRGFISARINFPHKLHNRILPRRKTAEYFTEDEKNIIQKELHEISKILDKYFKKVNLITK